MMPDDAKDLMNLYAAVDERIDAVDSFGGGRPPALPPTGGGEDNGDMERRLKSLEDFAMDARDRLARIETRMETYATKEDLKDLGMAIHQDINGQTWKFITWMTSICAVLVTATAYIVHHWPA